MLLNLFGPGEILAPVSWHAVGSNSSQVASMQVVECFYRVTNDRFAPLTFETIREPMIRAGQLLAAPRALRSSPDVLDGVLFDRLMTTKQHPLDPAGPRAVNTRNLPARAADTCVALEYLFHEGSTSEVQFRLSQTLAWLMESSPAGRQHLQERLGRVYKLRSAHLHGSHSINGAKLEHAVEDVLMVDQLLRRAILARLAIGGSDKEWESTFRNARVGQLPPAFDSISWLEH